MLGSLGGKTSCGVYYKPMTIVYDDSRVVNKLEASLTDNARVVIYNHQMFIVQATGLIKVGGGVQVLKVICCVARWK
jgi:hypothetical protein